MEDPKPKMLPQLKWKKISEIQKSKSKKGEQQALNFVSQLEFFSMIAELLKNQCYTTDDIIKITDQFINILPEFIKFEETGEQKKKLQDFLAQTFQSKKIQQLKYDTLMEFWKQQKKSAQLTHNEKSRIFHELLKQIGLKKNKNAYRICTDDEIRELVNLENLEKIFGHFGDKVYLTFDKIKSQTKKITHMLNQIFTQYGKDLAGFKYDLSLEEIKKIGDATSSACNIDQRGIYFLIVYFVKACRYQESQNLSLGQIQNKMQAALDQLTNDYPPGDKLQGDQRGLFLIRNISFIDQQGFPFEDENLSSYRNKKERIEDIIVKNANIAKQNRDNFQLLVKQACLKYSLDYKIGLKYNPQNPNKKAMVRISEKMLFKEEGIERKPQKNIEGLLESEDAEYTLNIIKKLQERQNIKFTVSDMVRGKCTFSSLIHILETIERIEKFINDENAKGINKYRIVEKESRFDRDPPISDVTLKIGINQKVISQLQLTLQTNVGAYNFAHKIYEFQRSKIFSKIKVLHNYYEEYRDQFDLLILQTFRIDDNLNQLKQAIQDYFQLDFGEQPPEFAEIVAEKLSKLNRIPKKIQLSQQNQLFIKTVICREVQLEKNTTNFIKQFLSSNQYSLSSKGMGLYQLIKDIDITEEIFKTSQDDQEGTDQLEQKTVSLNNYPQYLWKRFGIILGNHKDLLRSSWRLLSKYYSDDVLVEIANERIENYLVYESFLEDIYGKKSVQYLEWLIKSAEVFMNITAKQRRLEKAQNIMRMLNMKGAELLTAKINQKVGDKQFKNENYSQAEQLFAISSDLYKVQNMFNKVLKCKSRIADGLIKQKKLKEFIGIWQEIIGYKKNKNQNIKGILYYIDELEKILLDIEQKYQWQLNVGVYFDPQQIYESVKFQVTGPIVICEKKRSSDYRRNHMLSTDHYQREFLIDSNFSIIKSHSRLYPILLLFPLPIIPMIQKPLKYVSREIIEGHQKIGQKGCKAIQSLKKMNKLSIHNCLQEGELSRLKFSVEDLSLWNNKIGPLGCQHLNQKTLQNTLKTLNLNHNIIGDQGCKYLAECSWDVLERLSLCNNMIGPQGCAQLQASKWPSLTILILNANHATGQGCKELIKCSWYNLKHLCLNSCQIDDQGCKYLSENKWSLNKLFLNNNKIGPDGCTHLSKLNLLTELQLNKNEIQIKGYLILTQPQWHHLEIMCLNENQIGGRKPETVQTAKVENLNQAQNKKGDDLEERKQKRLRRQILKQRQKEEQNQERRLDLVSKKFKAPKLKVLSLWENTLEHEDVKKVLEPKDPQEYQKEIKYEIKINMSNRYKKQENEVDIDSLVETLLMANVKKQEITIKNKKRMQGKKMGKKINSVADEQQEEENVRNQQGDIFSMMGGLGKAQVQSKQSKAKKVSNPGKSMKKKKN